MTIVRQVGYIKSEREILEQLERIYTLYSRGFGTKRMIETCDEKVYELMLQVKY